MSRKLTLEEMAAELNFCAKTFKKYVKEYQIPHGGLGRNMRFDSNEVWAHLKSLSAVTPDERPDIKAKKTKKLPAKASRQTERYSQLLGLEGVH